MSQDPSRTTADVRVPAQATTQTRRLTSDPSDASLESDTPPDDAAIQRQREAGTRQRSFASPATAMRIGRFMVLEPLGRGGMGMVYAAYDDKLDRKVAIKVLLADDLPDDSDRLRLQREAQALARLSHPNVVTVHEVGDSDGQVFLAMEYVHGLSLRHWLRTKPDSSQVLDVFVLAGRGLAAAHHAGLVHRDLKPANIMRGDDGTVKVLDFGLALAVAEEQDESIDPAKLSGSHSPLHSSVTQTGTLLGTPAYMAPEQFTGNTADVYSDQYSFCIALWEGLTGRRPFAEATHDQRLTARLAGPPSWPPDAPALRRPIVEAMRRGLSPEPDDRWPSMDALLSALSRAPHRRRHGWALAGLGTAALAIGWLGLRDTPSVDREQRCTGAHEQLAGIWDDGRRAAVESAIVGTELSYAKGVWERTSATLDAYAHAWETMHTEACEATSIREEQSPRVLDLRMRCLGRATQDLQAVVDLLEDADAAVVDKAAQLAATLPPLSWCEDIESLEATVEPPQPEDANAVDTARHHLARAKSLRTTQRDEPASAAVTAAAAALEGVSYGPVNTELMLERGRVHTSLTEYDAAKDALHEALALALQWNQRSLAAEAAVRLVHLVGHLQLHPEAVASLEPVALGLAQGDVHAEITARMFIVEIHEQDQWDEAEQEYRRLLAVAEATPDIQPLLVSRIRDSLAYACLSTGKYAEAEAEYRSVLALAEQVQGSDHPKVARIRGRLGDALTLQGKLEEAEAELSRALVVVERALGADHLDVAVVHMQRGIVLHTQGRFEAAEAEYLTCMPTMLRVLGPKHPNIASARHNLANTLGGLGRHAEAEAEHRAGLAVRLEAFGPDHLQVAYSRSDLAQALERQGKLDEAVAEARAAVAVLERTVSPGHPNIASIRENLARMLRAQGKDEQADEVIEGPSAP